MADLMKVITPKRDIAESWHEYSTMTHDELDVLEDLLVAYQVWQGREGSCLRVNSAYGYLVY